MSNLKHEKQFKQLEESNQTLLNVANHYIKLQQSNTSNSIKNTLKDITIEIKKIKQKEFTIAVVGEVKSGKSTFINALVGYDLSHSRNHAATTYPIRIKHKKGQQKPSINLTVSQSFWDHVEKIKTKLELENFTNNHNEFEKYEETIKYIKDGKFTKETYTQENLEINDVRKLLKILHDLPRVSLIVLKDPRLKDLTENVIPEISLEFPTIRLHADNQEGIVLIDTPGVGEGGNISSHIMETVRTEISQASAVMVVLEHGGHGTQNEEEIKQLLEEVKSSSYIIAGKMDEYNQTNQIPINKLLETFTTKYQQYNFKKAFAISQSQALIGVLVQDYLNKNNGELEDPHKFTYYQDHPSYKVLEKKYGEDDMEIISGKEEGYKDLLKNDFTKSIEKNFINPKGYEFSKMMEEFQNIASLVHEKILDSSTKAFLKHSHYLKSEINKNLAVISGDIQTTEETLKSMGSLQQEMNPLDSNIQDIIKRYENDIDVLQKNLTKKTQSKLNEIITAFNDNITPDQLEENQYISITNVLKGDLASIKKSKTDEPALDFINNTRGDLSDAIQEEASIGLNKLSNEFSQEKKDMQEELININNKYDNILKTNYKSIDVPILNDYVKKAHSFDPNDIKNMRDGNTEKHWVGKINDTISSILPFVPNRSAFKNFLTIVSTTLKNFTKDVFNPSGFYAQFRHSVNDDIEKICKDIKNDTDKNIHDITDFQNAVNDQINDMLSILNDREKLSKNKQQFEKTINDYKEFIETIDNERTLTKIN